MQRNFGQRIRLSVRYNFIIRDFIQTCIYIYIYIYIYKDIYFVFVTESLKIKYFDIEAHIYCVYI